MLLLLGVLIAGTACQPAPSDPQPLEQPLETLEQQFQAELDAIHQSYEFPGATAAYILRDGSVGVAATGFSDVEDGTGMKPDSRMLAASIGKSFVGATAVALAQEGLVDLDDPISKWLGDRSWFSRLPNHQTITLRHLLTHSAGLTDHVYSEDFAQAFAKKWRDPGSPFTPEDLVEFVLDRPPLFEAGAGWAYTDTGYVLVGLIIESVSEHSYYEEVTRRFLVPLGLDMTSPSDHRDLPMLAAGYTAADHPFGISAKTTVTPGLMAWNPAVEWTGGGLVSNPRDLVVWAKALFEGRAMEGSYLEDLLRTVPVGGEGSGIRYGAGVGVYEHTPFGPSYGHGGGIPGYTSSLRYFPDFGVAAAFQINTDVGISDDSTPVVTEMERRLTEVVTSAVPK
jgi:D-alanyl-D-alanine carboxypeptidase